MTSERILILLAAPLFFAAITLILQRRWPLAAAITGGIATLLLATQSGIGPDGQVIHFFDGALTLTEQAASSLRLLYAGASLLFLLSARWPQGREFLPAGLAALSPLAATIMANAFPLGAVTLLAATACAAIMIQAGRRDATLAPFRYLTMTALALPFFLVAAWMLGSDQPVFTGSVWRLLLVGTALVLAGFPFHIWVRPITEDAPPLVTVYTFTLVPAALFFLLFNLLQQQPAVVQETPFLTLLRWSGVAAAVTGGLLALNAPSLKSLWGRLLLVEMGSAIMLIPTGLDGQQAALTGLGLRFVGLLLTSLGLILLESDPAGRPPHPTRRKVGAYTLFFYGALSLIGLPLTPGFPTRWATISAAALESSWLALFLLIAMASAAAGLLRWLASSIRRPADRPGLTAQ